jgi:NTP pyrophosphatase (non-canonical NTP hydrolase)
LVNLRDAALSDDFSLLAERAVDAILAAVDADRAREPDDPRPAHHELLCELAAILMPNDTRGEVTAADVIAAAKREMARSEARERSHGLVVAEIKAAHKACARGDHGPIGNAQCMQAAALSLERERDAAQAERDWIQGLANAEYARIREILGAASGEDTLVACRRLGDSLERASEERDSLRDALDRLHEFLDSRWRPVVRIFADAMEREFRANDHKPGWGDSDAKEMIARLDAEVGELKSVVEGSKSFANDSAEILSEAADVANFALIVADVCGALRRSAA